MSWSLFKIREWLLSSENPLETFENYSEMFQNYWELFEKLLKMVWKSAKLLENCLKSLKMSLKCSKIVKNFENRFFIAENLSWFIWKSQINFWKVLKNVLKLAQKCIYTVKNFLKNDCNLSKFRFWKMISERCLKVAQNSKVTVK